MINFGNLQTEEGLKNLNNYLADNSFVYGYVINRALPNYKQQV